VAPDFQSSPATCGSLRVEHSGVAPDCEQHDARRMEQTGQRKRNTIDIGQDEIE
jgi:hypothetical protein